MAEAPDTDCGAPGDRHAPRVEIAVAILLSVAGLATAWATYQASLWDGNQANAYADGAAKLTEATQLELQAGQIAAMDTMVFLNWLQAASRRDARAKLFFERRFRPEFAAQFHAWRAALPDDLSEIALPDARDLPPQPEIAYWEREKAEQLRREAEQLYAEGDEANAIGDRFVAVTVLLSTVLFLAGMAGILKRQEIRIAVIVLSGLLCVAALVFMALLPAQAIG